VHAPVRVDEQWVFFALVDVLGDKPVGLDLDRIAAVLRGLGAQVGRYRTAVDKGVVVCDIADLVVPQDVVDRLIELG